MDTETTPEAPPLAIGATIRALRKASGLTLTRLAAVARLSQPFLSQIENDQAMPSLAALHRIAIALGTTAQALLVPTSSGGPSLVRASDAAAFPHDEDTTVRFLVPGSDRLVGLNEVTAEPGATGIHGFQHAGDEVVHVLEGSIEFLLEGHPPVELRPGDTYAYHAMTPHSWRVVGDAPARFLMVGAPPSF